jgi:predicted DNA binding protein
MKEGFWDVPRRTTLTDLSKQLGVSKSTLSAQIQRINNRVMHTFSEEIRKRSN